MISVLVPVFNGEAYVERCVVGVLGQLGAGDEVVAVDDGSTDHSLERLQAIAARDSRLRVIATEHRGAASARGTAWAQARGEWVWMVDVDDFITEGAMTTIKQTIEANPEAQIICFNHFVVNRSGRHQVTLYAQNETITAGVDLAGRLNRHFVWDKVFRHNALEASDFPDGISNTEDFYLAVRSLARSTRVVCITDALYVHDTTSTSSTLRNRTPRHLIENRNHTLAIHALLKADIDAMSDEHARKVLREVLDRNVLAQLYAALYNHTPHVVNRTIKRYRALGLYPVGRTTNRRANLFRLLANQRWLFLAKMRFMLWKNRRHK